MPRREGKTVVITPELAIRMHKRMLESDLNWHQLAAIAKTHHSTIERLMGPDRDHQWKDPRKITDTILRDVLRALDIATDDVIDQIKPSGGKPPKLDAEQRTVLEIFNRLRDLSPALGAVAIKRLQKMEARVRAAVAEVKDAEDEDDDLSFLFTTPKK